jgi:hypothetical protein
VAALAPAHGIAVYPFLWAAGPLVAARSRRPVPLAELWALEREMARQLTDAPSGAQVRVRIIDSAPAEPR